VLFWGERDVSMGLFDDVENRRERRGRMKRTHQKPPVQSLPTLPFHSIMGRMAFSRVHASARLALHRVSGEIATVRLVGRFCELGSSVRLISYL